MHIKYSSMSNQDIHFQGEESELYSICSPSNVAVYKCLDLIRVELPDDKGTFAKVMFGKSFEDDEVPKEVAKQIRSYVKEQKRAIRENPRGFSPEEGRQKLFWILTMFHQHGTFSFAIGKIQTYFAFVFSQTKEDE